MTLSVAPDTWEEGYRPCEATVSFLPFPQIGYRTCPLPVEEGSPWCRLHPNGENQFKQPLEFS